MTVHTFVGIHGAHINTSCAVEQTNNNMNTVDRIYVGAQKKKLYGGLH